MQPWMLCGTHMMFSCAALVAHLRSPALEDKAVHGFDRVWSKG
jgi:hypothetical protein